MEHKAMDVSQARALGRDTAIKSTEDTEICYVYSLSVSMLIQRCSAHSFISPMMMSSVVNNSGEASSASFRCFLSFLFFKKA